MSAGGCPKYTSILAVVLVAFGTVIVGRAVAVHDTVTTHSRYAAIIKRTDRMSWGDTPGDSLGRISALREAAKVSAVVHPSGDTVLVNLTWLAEQTPHHAADSVFSTMTVLRLADQGIYGDGSGLARHDETRRILARLEQDGLFRSADPPEPQLISFMTRLREWLGRRFETDRERERDTEEDISGTLMEAFETIRPFLFIGLLLYLLFPIARSLRARRGRRPGQETGSSPVVRSSELLTRAQEAESEQRWDDAVRLYTAWVLRELTTRRICRGEYGITLRELLTGIRSDTVRNSLQPVFLRYEQIVYGHAAVERQDSRYFAEFARTIVASLDEVEA